MEEEAASMMALMPQEMLILVGGAGTRLRSVVNDVPKPMAPVAGRPFLEYLLDYWIDQGVRRFVLSVGYKGNYIKEHFGTRYKNAEVFCIHESSPLGTGGAIRMALQEIHWNGNYILLANGDTWFEVNLSTFADDAEHYVKPVTIALKAIEDNDRYGGVVVDGGLVTDFGVQSKKNCLINGGCYLLDIKFLSEFMRTFPDKFSFEEDVLKLLAAQNQVAASIQRNVFLDIGIPEDYKKAAEIVGHYKSKREDV